MKKVLLLLMGLIVLGCSKSEDKVKEPVSKYKELYKITDYFVDSLYNEYNSYGMEGFKYTKKTEDRVYSVTPFYRLIVVKIEIDSTHSKYEDLKKDLSKYYGNNWKVKDVYINQGGTVVIDCRR
nr:MAG TPA: lipoprotein [Caudoviricetes sp.]